MLDPHSMLFTPRPHFYLLIFLYQTIAFAFQYPYISIAVGGRFKHTYICTQQYYGSLFLQIKYIIMSSLLTIVANATGFCPRQTAPLIAVILAS